MPSPDHKPLLQGEQPPQAAGARARAGGVTLKRGVIDVAIEELTLTYERLALQ